MGMYGILFVLFVGIAILCWVYRLSNIFRGWKRIWKIL